MALRFKVLSHVLTVIADVTGGHISHTLVVQVCLLLTKLNAREVIAEIG